MDTAQQRSLFVRLARLAAVGLASSLAACSNLSGLGGSSEFQCKAPEGIPCQSISGVHFNERAGNLQSQRPPSAPSAASGSPIRDTDAPMSDAPVAVSYHRPVAAGVPDSAPPLGAIRSEPTVIRIWMAPWEDTDGDLHDQSYVYLQIDSGRWLIEHNRAQIRREFAPQRPTPIPVAAAASGASGAAVAPSTPASSAMSRDEAMTIGRALAQRAKEAASIGAVRP